MFGLFVLIKQKLLQQTCIEANNISEIDFETWRTQQEKLVFVYYDVIMLHVIPGLKVDERCCNCSCD